MFGGYPGECDEHVWQMNVVKHHIPDVLSIAAVIIKLKAQDLALGGLAVICAVSWDDTPWQL